jgi:hypothetical protein
LLGHVRLLLLLLLRLLLRFLIGPGAPDHSEETAHGGADGRTFSCIASDGPAYRAQRCPAKPAFEGAAPERLLRRRRVHRWGRRHGHSRIRRIETGLLHGPAVALALVRFFLLG